MNRTIIFLSFSFLIITVSCNKKNENFDYINKVQKELNSDVKNDTIFLGYTFGMTKKQFEKKTKELYKEGILYLNENNQYAHKMYLIKVLLENVEATFGPTYFGGKLYKLIVAVKDKRQFTTSLTPALLQITLKNLFSQKYGYSDWIEKKGLLEDEENYILIQGNREIEIIEGIGEARIFYTDLSVQKEFEKSQEKKSSEKINDTKSNL